MKYTALIAAAGIMSSAMAFVPSGLKLKQAEPLSVMTAERTSRRESVQQTLGLGAILMPIVLGRSLPAFAGETKSVKEPTPEFLDAQAKIAAFEKEQYEKKKEWMKRAALVDKATTEPELVSSLDNLTKFVLDQKGLPAGIKKQAMVTEIRKTKRKGKETGIWNKEAEIAYEDLIQAVNYMISPNTGRDRSNPL